MKLTNLSILAVLAIASQTAFAQMAPAPMAPAPMAAPGGSAQGGAAAGGATDASAVTNAGSLLASDVTTDETTTTSTSAIDAPTGEMANTGGEPELMLLAGVLLATGGLFLRRKTSAQAL